MSEKPVDIPEEAWGGLARDLIMWHDMSDRTPRALFEHLENCGREIPQWLRDEPEMRHLDHVPSKGTRAVLIWRAIDEKMPRTADPMREALALKAANLVTPQEFAERVEHLVRETTGQEGHHQMDILVTELLTELGYGEGAEIFARAAAEWHTA